MSLLKLTIYHIVWYFLLISYCESVSRTESGFDCISSCRIPTINGTKPICYYSRNSSDICKHGGEILEYFTENGEKCFGRCGKFNFSEDWCFLETLTWKRCGNLLKDWCFHEYITLEKCDSTPKLLTFLKKSINNPFTTQEYCTTYNVSNWRDPGNSGFYLNEIDPLIDRIFNDKDHFVTTRYNNSNNPIVAVSSVYVPGDSGSNILAHREPVTLTFAIRARIYFSHMRERRGSIPDQVKGHLRRMDRENDDEAGHLLADSLGGPSATFNFAPQSPILNRPVTPSGSMVLASSWRDAEALIRRFLNSGIGSYVSWGLLVEYRLYPASRRPTGFRLAIMFLDVDNHLVVFEGISVREYYFPNIPTVACSDRNHPWWIHWTSTQ